MTNYPKNLQDWIILTQQTTRKTVTCRDVAKKYNVSTQTGYNWLKRLEKDGKIDRDKKGTVLIHKSIISPVE